MGGSVGISGSSLTGEDSSGFDCVGVIVFSLADDTGLFSTFDFVSKGLKLGSSKLSRKSRL